MSTLFSKLTNYEKRVYAIYGTIRNTHKGVKKFDFW